MTTKEMSNLTQHILDEVRSMRDAGQKEYAHNKDNVFANFDRIGNLLDIDRKKVLMTYMLKHIDGIAAYVKGHKSQREDVTGRITDCIVYLTLLWGMIEDDSLHREKGNPSMHHMWDRLQDESGSVSNGVGSILADRISSTGDMFEMCKEGDGEQEESKEAGEPT